MNELKRFARNLSHRGNKALCLQLPRAEWIEKLTEKLKRCSAELRELDKSLAFKCGEREWVERLRDLTWDLEAIRPCLPASYYYQPVEYLMDLFEEGSNLTEEDLEHIQHEVVGETGRETLTRLSRDLLESRRFWVQELRELYEDYE